MDDSFQQGLILRLADKGFADRVIRWLRPEMFTPIYEDAVREALTWLKRKPLSCRQLRQLLVKRGIKISVDDPGGSDDDEFDEKEVITYARQHLLRQALVEAHAYTDAGQFDRAHRVISETYRKLPGNNGRQVVDVLQSTGNLPRREKLLPTMIPALDQPLGGGIGAGELAMVMAPTGGGKTTWLVYLGATACRQGKRVAYVTLEVPDYEIIAKAGQCLMGQIQPTGRNAQRKFQKACRAEFEKLRKQGGAFLVREHAPRTITATQALAEIEEDIDLVIIDYADYLSSPTRNSGKDYYDLGLIYEELKQYSMEHRRTVWTATQVNRGGYGTELLSIENVEASLKKGMVVDVAVSMNEESYHRAADSDTQESRLKLYVAKNRHGPRWSEISVTVHWPTSKFVEGRLAGI